jgi:hypothetical protein
MAAILQFPSQQVQGLAYLEEQLRDLLLARGADQELIDFAARTVSDVYQRNAQAENYDFSLALPAGIDESSAEQLQEGIQAGIVGIRTENHAIIVRLIAELVLAEVKIFQYQRDDISEQ